MYYDESIETVYSRVDSSEEGISAEEARKRLKLNGYNEMAKKKNNTFLIILLSQFNNFLIILLLIAASISLFLGEALDFFGILAIVILTVILGFVQEYRAEKSMEALEKISAPYAKVIRDGKQTSIPAREIVAGDIIVIEEGDILPADVRIIEESSLKIDESSLTGESVASRKSSMQLSQGHAIADQTNMAFMGTIVTYGKGKGVVIATGMSTEFGKIADTLQNTKDTQTPLQVKFEIMAKQLTFAVLALVALVFLHKLCIVA